MSQDILSEVEKHPRPPLSVAGAFPFDGNRKKFRCKSHKFAPRHVRCLSLVRDAFFFGLVNPLPKLSINQLLDRLCRNRTFSNDPALRQIFVLADVFGRVRGCQYVDFVTRCGGFDGAAEAGAGYVQCHECQAA